MSIIAPDRTKLERKKHKNFVSKLKSTRTKGKSGKKCIVKAKVKSKDSTAVTSQQRVVKMHLTDQ